MRTINFRYLCKMLIILTFCLLFICLQSFSFRTTTKKVWAADKSKTKSFVIARVFHNPDTIKSYSKVYVINSENNLQPSDENVKLISSFKVNCEISNLLGADDKYIFFQCPTNNRSGSLTGSLMRCDIDGKNIMSLTDKSSVYSYNYKYSKLICERNTGINGLADGFLFYADSSNRNFFSGNNLKKISIDGKTKTDIKMYARCIFTYKGKVYFLSNNSSIIKIDPDGKNMKVIGHNFADSTQSDILSIVDDRIVYTGPNIKTYSIKTDGTSKRLLLSNNYPSLIQDGWIYYNADKNIYREKVDGTTKQEVYVCRNFINKEFDMSDAQNLENNILPYGFDDNYFYFINSTSSKFYDGNTSGGGPTIGSREIYAEKLDISKEFPLPYAFAVLDGKAFCTDKSNNIYYTKIGETKKTFLK